MQLTARPISTLRQHASRISLIALGLFVAAAALFVPAVAPDPALASHKSNRGLSGRAINDDGRGYSVEASLYVGEWNCRGSCLSTENTYLYLLNPMAQGGGKKNNSKDEGVDVLIFVYGAGRTELACGFANLIGNQVIQVDIGSLPTVSASGLGDIVDDSDFNHGTIKVLVFRGGEGLLGDHEGSGGKKNNDRKDPISWPLGAWTMQVIGSGEATGPAAEMFPVPLSGDELDRLRDDFKFADEPCSKDVAA